MIGGLTWQGDSMRESFQILSDQVSHIPFISNYGIDFAHFKDSKGLWKAHYYDGSWKRLKLNGIPHDCTECQITSEKHDNMIILSLICGYSSTDINYCGLYLVTFIGNDLEHLRMTNKKVAISGHANSSGIQYATPINVFLYGKQFRYKMFPKMFRMCYDPDDHNTTFVTYGNGIIFRTFSINRNLECFEYKLKDTDQCLYKFCKGNGGFYYATKNEDDRHILFTDRYDKIETDIDCLFSK